MSINRLESDAPNVARLKRGVDMTSAVKQGLYDGTWGFSKRGLHSTSLRAAEEPELVTNGASLTGS